MFNKSAWLHLRIPFSYFLFPVFFFALAVSPNFTEHSILWTFLIVHLFLYPASNGYNSYFDKDEQSIGGLKNPPPVNKGLYWLSLVFDLIGVTLAALMINFTFAVMLLIYGFVSKAYSHPWVRLKKYAIAGWLTIGIFQGFFAFLMCYAGINGYDFQNLLKLPLLVAGSLTTLMLLASYPMTQVYQHEEDGKRGDQTISLKLGVRGTFLFTGGIFGLVAAAFFLYFSSYFNTRYAFLFVGSLLPVVSFFLFWFLSVLRNPAHADHKRTMWLNFISATCLTTFFIYLFLDSTQVLQTLQ